MLGETTIIATTLVYNTFERVARKSLIQVHLRRGGNINTVQLIRRRRRSDAGKQRTIPEDVQTIPLHSVPATTIASSVSAVDSVIAPQICLNNDVVFVNYINHLIQPSNNFNYLTSLQFNI